MAFLVGKTAVTCAFGTVYLYTSELYPTPVRTLGVGISSMVGRVGAMASPYVALMAHWAVWVPAAAFAAAALLAAAAVRLLPEVDLPVGKHEGHLEQCLSFQTLGCELPDSVEAALALGRGRQHDVFVEDEVDGHRHVDERTPLIGS
jgi:MFS family permease